MAGVLAGIVSCAIKLGNDRIEARELKKTTEAGNGGDTRCLACHAELNNSFLLLQ